MTLKKALLIGSISMLSILSSSASLANTFSTVFTGDNFVNSFTYKTIGNNTTINTTILPGSQDWTTSTNLHNISLSSAPYEFIWEVQNDLSTSGFLAEFTFDNITYTTSADPTIWQYSNNGTTWNNVTSYGSNDGSAFWPTINNIDSTAEWIWDRTQYDSNETLFFKASVSPTSPVPEPSTYALMLGGLGMVGFMAHRRKRQKTS